ncbi:type IV pilus assembly protein PilM [Amphritea opalescens]|uniref:Type IV pilus assembly protein PilM n=1 Tax=Amphritea opalescens TaxID=2490544 RepID=A0A430KUR4_9GAMM|nr:type IV pilus assembly protein PilM [Amphritea opalescens]RTE67242.1 type IV pilus assembly protein PilM [Amphritea opalescens]
MLSFLSKQEKGWVGIDIGSSSIKMVALSRRGKGLRLDSYAIVPLPASAVIESSIQDAAQVAEAIEAGIKICGGGLSTCVAAVPSSAVITKTIQLSNAFTDFELEEQVKLEADRFIPYPLNEIALDFEVLGPAEDSPELNDILLVACRRDDVEIREDAINSSGLKCEVVDVDRFATERVVSLLEKGDQEDRLVGFVDIGASTLTLNVFKNGKIVYDREQAFGGNDLSNLIHQQSGLEAGEVEHLLRTGELSDELKQNVVLPFRSTVSQQVSRSLQFFYSSGPHNELSKLYILGGTAAIEGLAEQMQNEIGVEVEVANPFAGMDLDSKINAGRLNQDAPTLVKACGLALRSFEG